MEVGGGGGAAQLVPPPASLIPRRTLAVNHALALACQWDAEEQQTLDSVLSKYPASKHGSLER